MYVKYFQLSGIIRNSGNFGYFIVQVFFIISGFSPYTTYKNHYLIQIFFQSNIEKSVTIDPTYFVAVGISLVLMIVTKRKFQDLVT